MHRRPTLSSSRPCRRQGNNPALHTSRFSWDSKWSPRAALYADQRVGMPDTDGRGLMIEPHPASIQDRDGGGPLLQASRRLFSFIERVFADGEYAGERYASGEGHGDGGL